MDKFKKVLQEMSDIYTAKNHDYGASADKTYEEFGLTAYLVRMSDKLNRAKTLMNAEAMVSNEKMRDTLLDLAVYSAMAVARLDEDDDEEDEPSDLFSEYLEMLKMAHYTVPEWKIKTWKEVFNQWKYHSLRVRKSGDCQYTFEVYGFGTCGCVGPITECTMQDRIVLRNAVAATGTLDKFLSRIPHDVDIFAKCNWYTFRNCIRLCNTHTLTDASVEENAYVYDNLPSNVSRIYTFTFVNESLIHNATASLYS